MIEPCLDHGVIHRATVAPFVSVAYDLRHSSRTSSLLFRGYSALKYWTPAEAPARVKLCGFR